MGGLHGRSRPRPAIPMPPSMRPVMALALRACARRREALYVVGGTVRDLLLGRTPRDLDLMVEGDALRLGRELAETTQAPLHTHRRFGTASLHLPSGVRVDLASPRREAYACGGALPRVASTDVLSDLRRRDFTINAMAWRWHRHGPGRLLDVHGGQEDLRLGLMRILHDDSFQEDPTRGFRATRLAARFGFRLAPPTARALRQAVSRGVVDTLSAARLGREMSLLSEEACWPRVARDWHRRGLLRAIHAGFRPAPLPACRRLADATAAIPAASRLALIMVALTAAASPSAAAEALQQVQLPAPAGSQARQWLAAWQRFLACGAATGRHPDPCLARRVLSEDPQATLLAATLAPQSAMRRTVAVLQQRVPTLRLRIDTHDLERRGIPRGPEWRLRLENTRLAVLLRQVGDDRAAQLAYACSARAKSGLTRADLEV